MIDCPKCGSTNVDETNVEGDGSSDWHDWKCFRCGFKWYEIWACVKWSYDGGNEYDIGDLPPGWEHKRHAIGVKD